MNDNDNNRNRLLENIVRMLEQNVIGTQIVINILEDEREKLKKIILHLSNLNDANKKLLEVLKSIKESLGKKENNKEYL